MNGRFQMQGGKNWILPKEMNANRYSSGTLIGWKSGQTTYVPLWGRIEEAWLWTLVGLLLGRITPKYPCKNYLLPRIIIAA
jgi:hypothetical protein